MIFVNEIKIFLASVAFLSRIPVPLSPEFIKSIQHKTPRYYPYAGILIGGISSAIYLLLVQMFSHNISLLLSIASVIFVTGAFHEDGLMDFADGFGGGYGKEDILRIMKDPHTGTYGTVAIILALSIKYSVLSEMDPAVIPFVFIYAHSLSRFLAVSIIPFMDYARSSGKSSFLSGRMKYTHLIFAFTAVLIPVILFQKIIFIMIVPVMFLPVLSFFFYIKRKIGGYTGDCLGALQQISEILIYASVHALIFILEERNLSF